MGSLAQLVLASQELSATRGRTAKIERLSHLLRALAPPEAALAALYMAGELGLERPLGIGWETMQKAWPEEAASEGSLDLTRLDFALRELSQLSGPGSQAERVRRLQTLLLACSRSEQEWLRRLLGGELRQGALAGLVTEALAQAVGVSGDRIRTALMLCADLRAVAEAALTGGEAALSQFRLQLFRPLAPMLAQTAQDPEEVCTRLGQSGLEFKLDGARIQVHREGSQVAIFSRGLKEVTESLPEVVEAVLALPAHSLVLDGEVLAMRPDGGPEPFQTTMRRFGRKLEVAELRRQIPVQPFFFDCLYHEGESLLQASGRQRWQALESALADSLRVPRRVATEPGQVDDFLARALACGHEGIMAKSLEDAYQAGGRGHSWLKLKTFHTLDLVVLAVEWGSGRRRGLLSNLHLGARSEQGYVMLGKTFKGLTDEMLAWQTRRFLELEVGRDGHIVRVRPEQVVEIAFSDVQESPHYPAGMALRFARVKGYRNDKPATEADTLERVRSLFEAGRQSPR